MSGLDPYSLRSRHRDLGIEVAEQSGPEMRVTVSVTHAWTLLSRLRDEEEFAMKRLVDLTAIDRGDEAQRFEVVYRLHSIEREASIRVHVQIDREGAEPGSVPTVDSVTSLWPVANWLEREVFDLFGIHFKGHPDLRRLLLDEGFEGSPLRKDHPLRLARPLPKEGDG